MIYHVTNKSIADFVIFNNPYEYSRMLLAMRYYQSGKRGVNLSRFIRSDKSKGNCYNYEIVIPPGKEKFVNIIAYCLMPTHIHLILEELKDRGIPIFINNLLNSYTRYFNIKHNRKGPLWQSRSKKILVKSNEQLLHLTRYIHLNPVTAYLVNKPEEWPYSSYKEYIHDMKHVEMICKYEDLLTINRDTYKEFVEQGISYQRELAHIKNLLRK